MPQRMPGVFFGHGNPMNALLSNAYTRGWAAIGARIPGPLIDYESLGKDALLSVPTPEHDLPLLYVLGARIEGEAFTFPVEGMDGGSVDALSPGGLTKN